MVGARRIRVMAGPAVRPPAALAMVFKLVESAQDRWRGLTGAHLVALAPFRRQVREQRPGRTRGGRRSLITRQPIHNY